VFERDIDVDQVMKRIDNTISITSLGQTGFKFVFDRLVVYIDPYLTDSVAETEGAALRRMTQPPIRPEQVQDADLSPYKANRPNTIRGAKA